MTAMYEGAGLPPAMTSVREAVSTDNPEVGIFATAAEAGDPMPAIPAMAVGLRAARQGLRRDHRRRRPDADDDRHRHDIREAIGG